MSSFLLGFTFIITYVGADLCVCPDCDVFGLYIGVHVMLRLWHVLLCMRHVFAGRHTGLPLR